MALDTDDKRLSAMNIASPWRGLLPLPAATIPEASRLQFLFLARDPLPDTPGGGELTDSIGPLIGVNRLVGV